MLRPIPEDEDKILQVEELAEKRIGKVKSCTKERNFRDVIPLKSNPKNIYEKAIVITKN
jgi:hypothetical protein